MSESEPLQRVHHSVTVLDKISEYVEKPGPYILIRTLGSALPKVNAE